MIKQLLSIIFSVFILTCTVNADAATRLMLPPTPRQPPRIADTEKTQNRKKYVITPEQRKKQEEVQEWLNRRTEERRLLQNGNNGKRSSGITYTEFIGNVNSHIYHSPDCSSVRQMKEQKKRSFTSIDEVKNAGYRPCRRCNPSA